MESRGLPRPAHVYFQQGGPLRLTPSLVPLGHRLPYRRSAGEGPAGPTELMERCAREGWRVEFCRRIRQAAFVPEEHVLLGDFLLAMAVVRAILDAHAVIGVENIPPIYCGPYTRLMERCEIDLETAETRTGTVIESARGPHPVPLEVRPCVPPRWREEQHRPDRRNVTMPIWLDPGEELVDVHAAVPMRHYLRLEQDLGVRLPADNCAAPRYRTRVAEPDEQHVVLVATTSQPEIKDYGVHRFVQVAHELRKRSGRDLRFTLLTNDEHVTAESLPSEFPLTVLHGIDAADCVDLFGTAALVVGNDTGLVHLAALTVRPDGTGPQVLGLYNIFSPLKWVTGSPRHHTASTSFAQQLAMADVDIPATSFAAQIDPVIWGEAARLESIPPGDIAEFAAERVGWV